jgi:(S)-3,5-dihydroxyphenylglycine transaminase
LLELAEIHNFLIVEDNPYGYFIYDGAKIPTLKALDRYGRVLYLGSFSKTLFPSIRLGFIAAGQEFSSGSRQIRLVEELKKTKSFTTVNTSTLLQAIADSYLRGQNYSLVDVNAKKIEALRLKRDTMVAALRDRFPGSGDRAGRIKWNNPAGGFFLVIDLPFKVTQEHLRQCVENHSVIFCPMSFFCLRDDTGDSQIRLAFSNLSPAKIEQGIDRLAAFIKGVADRNN